MLADSHPVVELREREVRYLCLLLFAYPVMSETWLQEKHRTKPTHYWQLGLAEPVVWIGRRLLVSLLEASFVVVW